MATTRKLILERQILDLEGAGDLKAVKRVIAEALKEIKASHEASRNDTVAIEARLDAGGL